MVSVTLPCHIDTTNTTKQLSKNVCQNETGAAVTSLTTKCTDNHGGTAQTEVISGALVSGAAALLASYLLHCSASKSSIRRLVITLLVESGYYRFHI